MGLFTRDRPNGLPVNPDTLTAAATSKSSGSMTAAGQKVERSTADALRRVQLPWQSRALAYYDLLGEIKYAAQFYSRSLAKLILFPATIEVGADGRPEIRPTENPAAMAALDRIQDPGGGRSGLLAAYGRLMFLTGEALLLCSVDDRTGMEQWEMLSSDELRIISSSSYTRYRAPSVSATEYKVPADDDYEPVEGQAIAYRLWKRHVRFSEWADSSMQGVLDLCELLTLMTQGMRANARSRLAGSGILFVDERITGKLPVQGPNEDPVEDAWLMRLYQAFTASLVDQGSAASVVPILARVPGMDQPGMSIRDMVYHLRITDPSQLYPETTVIDKLIERLAIGLDMPPEILTGIGDQNHWNGWLIDEDAWSSHLQPVATQLVDDLTAAFFRPQLREDRVPDWQKYVIAYDASQIITHPDRGKDAKDLYDRIAIGKAALREATGFDERDAPTEAERVEQIGVKVRDGLLALTGEPSAKDAGAPANESSGQGPTGPPTGSEVEKGPPEQPTADPAVEGNGSGFTARHARILGACEFAVLRAREAAGNRLLAVAKRDTARKRLLQDVHTGDVAATLGREKTKALGAPADGDLVTGARALILDALRMSRVRGDVAEKIADQIEQHVVRTLYQPGPVALPATFESYLQGILADKVRP